jgi:hypothetical protein
MRKHWKGFLIAVGVAFLGIQFIRPARTNAPIEPGRTLYAQVAVPLEARQVLERSCVDCHSQQTRWPWYSGVAPVSWFVIDHVKHGREHFDFSEWASYDANKADDLLEEICEETSKGKMPLPSYLLMHRGARLAPQDVRALCEWSKAAREQLAMKARGPAAKAAGFSNR